MKTRNLLLALTCIALFIFAGVLYFKSWVVQKPFAIVLITGDGVNSSSLAAARIYGNGADHDLEVERLPHSGLLRITSNEFAVPDAPAAASALATGKRVNQNALSVDANGKNLPTLLELASRAGRKTGLVTNAAVVDPALAAYFAHARDGLDLAAIATQLPHISSIDLLLGGGEKYFLPVEKGGIRTDGQDLMLTLRQQKWTVTRTKAELAAVQSWLTPRTLGIFNRDDLPSSRSLESGGQEPSLEEMIKSAISILQYNTKGYFLVIDAGLIEKSARANKGEETLSEIIALDHAVGIVRRYAGDNALIIVAGKQSPGGLRMNGYPFRQDQGAAVLGVNNRGIPSITWSTGPNAMPTTIKSSENTADSEIKLPAGAAIEPATVFTPEALNIVDDSLIFSLGAGTEKLTGYRTPADIFEVLKSQF